VAFYKSISVLKEQFLCCLNRMAFSFGFSGDDFEVDTAGNNSLDTQGPVDDAVAEPTMPPRLHKVEDLVS
jgi:hypothetical protein